MSRSGYSEDYEYLNLYRASVWRATHGERGQRLLRDLLAALDAMPVKRLIRGELVEEGEVCALGALGVARGLDMNAVDPTEPDEVAEAFDIAQCLAREIVYENDEREYRETPEQRWQRMRDWVAEQINGEPRR